ncbi:MAG TPA: VOC family protein [Candidatus Binatia bacterium]|jgi:hypothetical protein
MSRIFGAIRQNGYVVRDIRAAMDHWSNVIGVGPCFYFDRVEVDYFRHRGKDSEVALSIALANSGALQIELIQQRNAAPSMYLEFLEAGHEGLQHVAYWTTEYQALYDRALALGYAVGQEGQIGGAQGRFAYLDTQRHPGTVVELSDVSGAKGTFFEHVCQSSINWDGSQPIRDMG